MKTKITYLMLLISPFFVLKEVKAEPFNYNYAEASYVYVSPDSEILDDSHGVRALLSWSPIEHFMLEGGYEFLHTGLSGAPDIDTNEFRLGLGAYTGLIDGLDIVGRLGLVGVSGHLNDVSDDQFDGDRSEDEGGAYAGAALRFAATQELELEPSVEYSDVGDASLWFYDLKALYNFSSPWDAALSAGISEESDVRLTAGLRYNFGCNE